MSHKILSIDSLTVKLRHHRKERKSIVTYNGSFDVLHVGHIHSLQEAKSKGDILVVLLNSDVSVRSYKGPGKPIVPEVDRAQLLEALECVDYITVFDDLTPVHSLQVIRPDIFCNGGDWGANCVERATVEENGGRVEVLSWNPAKSTSLLLERIRSSQPPIRAVFFDRDKTLNADAGYTHKVRDYELLPGVLDALKILERASFKKIIVTNQSGIGRSMYTQKDFDTFMEHMISHLHDEGVTIDRVYHCPHHPDDQCGCRKPQVGLFLEAVKDFGISLSNSWYIGDKPDDVLAGRMANIKTIKIGGKMPSELKLEPDYYAQDLVEAVEYILQKER